MKKIILILTTVLILSCNNTTQNKDKVDSIPMTKINAANDNECHDILFDWREECDSKYDNLIMESVSTAPCYALANDEESGIVETFTT